MMTFLPYEDFEKSARVLDYQRLNSQRREATFIFNALIKLKANPNQKIGWINHPATRMWEGCEALLAKYVNVMLTEWKRRGYKCTMEFIQLDEEIVYPWWLGNEDFHRSHRARLIDKYPSFYLPKFPNDANFNDGRYLWPDYKTHTFQYKSVGFIIRP
jgi:hypothetical protein